MARLTHLITIVLIVLIPLLQLRCSIASATGSPSQPPPADLMALVLNGNDLISLGYPGYGTSNSYYATDPSDAGKFIANWGMDTAVDDGDILRHSGADRIYIQLLDNDTVIQGTGDSMDRSLVFSTMLEYADNDAASEGIQTLSDAYANVPSFTTYTPDQRVDADDAVLIRGTGQSRYPRNGSGATPRTNAILRTGNLVAVVAFLAYDGKDVSEADFEDLISIQADRLLQDENPGLSAHLLRLDVDPTVVVRETYIAIDGVTLPNSNIWEGADTYAARQKETESSGLVNSMHAIVKTYALDQIYGPFAFINIFLEDYDSRNDAHAAFTKWIKNYTKANFFEYAGPDLGDESAYLYGTFNQGDETNEYAVVFVRVGTTVFFIRNFANTSMAEKQGVSLHPSPKGLATLAQAQTACVEDTTTCVDAMPVPRVMIREQVRDDATPPAPIETEPADGIGTPTHRISNATSSRGTRLIVARAS